MNKTETVIDLIDNLSKEMTKAEYEDFLIEINQEINARLEALDEETDPVYPT